MCTRWTGPRRGRTGPPSRVSLGWRRMVWSKMKMREAPVLGGVSFGQGAGGGREGTHASLSSCSVSG